MGDDNNKFSVQAQVRIPWRQYLDDLIPIRRDLFLHCKKLTGNIWDAEDLVQDTLLKVFSSLGKIDADIQHPKAYLTKTATHLWIDTTRRQSRWHAYEVSLMTDDEPSTEDHPEVTDAVQTLMHKLHPQERSALVMKEVLGYSLDEIATTLDTSVGAIKAALNRARGRLHKQSMPPASYAADKEMVNQFLHALQKTDLDTLRSICASELHVELVGGAEMRSFEESKNFFAHAHFVMPEIGFGENPWWRYAEVDHEPLVLGFRTLNGIEGLNEIHRLEVNNGQIARIRCYCFCPDTLAAVAEQINAVALERPYRSPTP